MVPVAAPVILPEQVRLPLVPSNVQPVSAEPPERTIDPLAPVGPILREVVAPDRRVKVVDAVVIDVAMAGLVIEGVLLKTTTPPPPLPVSSDNVEARSAEPAVVVKFLDASRNKALEAVRADKLIVASARVVFPVPLASNVRFPLAPVAIVNAPESAILLVVNV